MEQQESQVGSKRDSRHVSHNRAALTRKITTGPLEADDPLAVDDAAAPVKHRPKSPLPISPDATKQSSPTASLAVLSPPPRDYSYLLRPEIYHPLTQYDVPLPFRTAPQIPDITAPLSTLLVSGQFRLAATKAAALLTRQPAPPTESEIFSLLYTRLACLTLINATPLAAQEAKCLEDLNSTFYRHPETGTHLVPWELRVLAVRLLLAEKQDARAVMAYYELARDARGEVGRTKGEERSIWKDRLRDLGTRVANALVEMGDLVGACRHLETLAAEGEEGEMMRGRLGLLWLRIGNLEKARRYIVAKEGSNQEKYAEALIPLLSMAEGDYESAASQFAASKETKTHMLDPLVTQNLAVCLLYTGKLDAARLTLDSLVSKGYSFHTLLFNLSTVFELCTDRAKSLKMELATKVAGTGGTDVGWERNNVDFKL